MIPSRPSTSSCRCGRPSTTRRSSVISAISENTFEFEDNDGSDNGESDGDCDICQSLAPRKASRTHLMQTLRHFLRDEHLHTNAKPMSIAEMSEEHDDPTPSCIHDSTLVVNREVIEVDVSSTLPANPPPPMDIDIPVPCQTTVYREKSHVSSCSNLSFGHMSDFSEDMKDTPLPRGCFFDVLETALAQGRVMVTVSGHQIKESFVQFLVLVQVSVPYCLVYANLLLGWVCELS